MARLIKDKDTGVIYRIWPADRPRAVFLLVHGLGAHSARWNFLSDFFLQSNISSYAIELKGFGETESLKGHIDSFRVYLDNLFALRRIAGTENKGKKVFLLGESLGAIISCLALMKNPYLAGGLICISPAFASRLKISPLQYMRMLFFLLVKPEKQFKMPFNSEMCTRDLDYRKTMNEDPREHRLATAKLLAEALAAQIKCAALKDRIKIPVLFLLAGEDSLANPEISRRIFKGLKTEDKTLLEYPGMYHALSIGLGREKVFGDIREWVEKRI